MAQQGVDLEAGVPRRDIREPRRRDIREHLQILHSSTLEADAVYRPPELRPAASSAQCHASNSSGGRSAGWRWSRACRRSAKVSGMRRQTTQCTGFRHGPAHRAFVVTAYSLVSDLRKPGTPGGVATDVTIAMSAPIWACVGVHLAPFGRVAFGHEQRTMVYVARRCDQTMIFPAACVSVTSCEHAAPCRPPCCGWQERRVRRKKRTKASHILASERIRLTIKMHFHYSSRWIVLVLILVGALDLWYASSGITAIQRPAGRGRARRRDIVQYVVRIQPQPNS